MRRFALALSIVLLWACPSISAAEERHSGAVVSIDRAAGTLVMTELTASRSEAPVMVKRTIKLTPDSQIMLLQRSQEDATTSGWPGGFVASSVTADDYNRDRSHSLQGPDRRSDSSGPESKTVNWSA